MTTPAPQQYPEQSQGTTALVLGILGVLGCLITAPFAWYLGNKEVAGIDQGLRNPANRGLGTAGKVLGIIGTVFLGLAVVFFVILPIIAILFGTVVTET